MSDFDVIVVGAGNAALAASVSAVEHGARRVVVLEKAPRDMRGGNTHWSGGLLRIAYDDVADLEALVPDAEEKLPGFTAGVEPYTRSNFHEDLQRVTGGRSDPVLASILIDNSYDTVRWMHEHAAIPMEPAFSLGGIRIGNIVKWPRGAVIRAQHEGVGLSRAWFQCAQDKGVEVRYGAAAMALISDSRGRVAGVEVRNDDGIDKLAAGA
ncbi:MAG: FAD-binding protein, partial [Lysobacterales bacterium]